MRHLLLIALVGLSTACATTSSTEEEDAPPASAGPPSYAEVPFAKATNAAFRDDLRNKRIKVRCQFVGTDAITAAPMFARSQGVARSDDVFFAVGAPGAAPADNPLAAAAASAGRWEGVFVAKAASDPVFALQPGQPVVLYGKFLTKGIKNAQGVEYDEMAFLRVERVEAAP